MKELANRNPKSLADAINFLQAALREGRTASPVGGGSDLLGLIKDGLAAPDELVNLKSLAGLDRIEQNEEGVKIGGLVTLAQLADNPAIVQSYRPLAEAAGSVGTPQIRNTGTLAGNVCQRPWCWYLRQGFPCYKNGGAACFSIIGENQFNAIFAGGPSFIVHPSDTAPALLSLGATFRILSPNGERSVAAADFFTLPSVDVRRENILNSDEILIQVELPPVPQGRVGTYQKITDRQAWTHAVVSVAAVLDLREGRCQKASITLGGVAPVPWPLPAVADLLAGQRLTRELAQRAARLSVEDAVPLSKNSYKIKMTEALVRRTLASFA